jgi:uncharacterized Zn-binding protein involved in type VI secretion
MTVLANNMDIAANSTAHTVIYMAPSVCITPAAPSPMPIPYPITSPAGTKVTEDHTSSVKIGKRPVLCLSGVVQFCVGNEPGTQNEVVSLTTHGKGFLLVGSPNVKIEGSPPAFNGSTGMGNRR